MSAFAPMFALLRALAPAVLLVATISGHTASGLVLAHVAVDHATVSAHDHHGDETASGHHHGDTDHGDAGHGDGHSHELTPTSAALARLASASLGLQAPPALLHDVVALPDAHSLQPATPRARLKDPPEPQRHSILRI